MSSNLNTKGDFLAEKESTDQLKKQLIEKDTVIANVETKNKLEGLRGPGIDRLFFLPC